MHIVQKLQQGFREFEVPADLVLADGETLRCVEILRVLPGKRAVMKAQWQGRSVLVKLILNTAPGRRDLRRELAGYHALKTAETSTPELLLTTRSDNGSHVLVFEFLEQAQSLGDLWRDDPLRRLVLGTSGLDLIARLHQKGCCHLDLHLDNFLLANEQLYVIDAASVERRSSAEYGNWQRENLALFLVQFAPLWRKTLMDLLAAHYAAAAADPELEEAVSRAWQRRKSRYLKKCFRESSEFSTQTSWRKVAVWKRARHSDDLVSFLQNPDAWIEKGELLKDGNSATVVRVSMNGQAVVIKRNNIKNLRHRWRRFLRPTRSHTNWRNAHLLKISGIATPEPIAFVEKRRGPFRLRGYYVCAFNSFPPASEKYASQQPTKQELAWFEELFTGMRLARLYHSDLKASNLLVADKEIVLVDLDSMKECAAKANMDALLQKDRDRFLKNWNDKPEQRKLFSGIFSKA